MGHNNQQRLDVVKNDRGYSIIFVAPTPFYSEFAFCLIPIKAVGGWGGALLTCASLI